MKNNIKWYHISLEFKKQKPEEQVPFATAVLNNLGVDPDVPEAGSPVAKAVYNQQITDVATGLVLRQTNSSKQLTVDEHVKVNVLQNSTESIGHYVEIIANTKFPGDENTITQVFNRFGFSLRKHGKADKHTFEIIDTGPGSAGLHTEVGGLGAVYHWRWSADQATWKQVRSTHESAVVINALPRSTRIHFQYAISLPAGVGNKQIIQADDDELVWSDPISGIIP